MVLRTRFGVVFVTLSIYTGLIFPSEFDTPNKTSKCYNTSFTRHLLSTIVSQYYNVWLRIEESYFEGKVTISFELLEKTEIIAFYVSYLEIDLQSIVLSQYNPNSAEVEQPKDIYHCKATNTVTLLFDELICPEYYNITMRYRGSPYEKNGFHRIKQEKEKDNVTWSYVTMFEAGNGEYIFPCWKKEVISKPIFKISVEYLGSYRVFSNIVEEKYERVGEDTIQTIFKPAPVISTDLLTIAVIKLDELSESQYNIWFEQEGTNKTDSLVRSVIYIADEFLTQYTQTRLEVSIIVIFSDVLRNTIGARQLVFLREGDLIYDRNIQFAGRILEIWKTIAYAKAEQYIQSFINLNNWSDVCFSKALALYLSYNILGYQSFNSKKMMELFVVQVQLPAMHNDIALKVPSITDPYDPIYSIFVYKKVSVLLKMIEQIVSKEVFQKAVAEYLHIYAYRSSTPIDFFNILSKFNKSGYMITDIMSIWLSQRYYPIVIIVQNPYTKTYYVYNEIKRDFHNSIKWPVPLTYATKKDPQFSQYALIYWMNYNYTKWNSYLELTLDNVEDWIILNVQYFGYYRVRYDNSNWLKIAHFLKEDYGKTIPVLNRVQLIDDAYHFVMMGTMDYKFYYEIIDFLRNETDFIVWHSMMNVLHYTSPFFKFPESEGFKDFIMDIMNDALTQIGYDEKPTDDNMLKSTRLLLLNWMCNHGNDKCKQSASDKLRAYVKYAKESLILPGWKNWVYCAGVMKPDRELRRLIRNKMLCEIDENVVQYLSCYDDDNSIQNLLTLVKSDNIMSPLDYVQEENLYRAVVKKHARKSKILDFLLETMVHLSPGNMTLLEKLGHVIMSVYSKCQLEKIKKFVNNNMNLDEAMYEVKRILTRQMSQISKQRDMFIYRFPYVAKQIKYIEMIETRIGVALLSLLLNIGIISVVATDINTRQWGYCTLYPHEIEPYIYLVDNIIPQIYHIKLKIYQSGFDGDITIEIAISAAVQEIRLHVHNLYIEKDTITLIEQKDLNQGYMIGTLKAYSYCGDAQILILKFDSYVRPGLYKLSMKYRGVLMEERLGFVQTVHEVVQNKKKMSKWSYITDFEPYKARLIFPCWDVPSYKTPFNISIEHQQDIQVFSNMPHKRNIILSNMNMLTIFELTPPMSTYQVTMAIIPSDNKYSLEDIWFSSTMTSETFELVEDIIDATETFLIYYTENLWQRFIVKIIGYPHLPMKSTGSMGLAVFRESDLLYMPEYHFPGRTLDIWKLITYEMARQCTENVLSPIDWPDLWFSRALALFFSYKILMEDFNEVETMQLFVVQIQQPAMYNDVALNVSSIVHIYESNYYYWRNVAPYPNLRYDLIYSPFIYKKASVLMRMLEHIVTKQIFREAYIEYLHRYMNKYISPNIFFAIINNKMHEAMKTHIDIKSVMHIWLLQKKYPTLMVKRNYNSNSMTVTCYNVEHTFRRQHVLSIPITYAVYTPEYSSLYMNNSELLWLNDNSSVEITHINQNQWILLNIQQFGYYRVNYDNQDWLRIASFLNNSNYKQIHVLNRAQILDDAYYFLMENNMNYHTYYCLIAYLRKETSFIVWHTMMNVLHYMSSFFKFAQSFNFKKYMLRIMDELIITEVGYYEKNTHNLRKNVMRLLLLNWSCKHGSDRCRQEANNMLAKHIEDPVKYPILPWWKDWVYCAGLMKTNNTIWNRVQNNIKHGNNLDMLYNLACNDNNDMITNLLTADIFKTDNEWLYLNNEQQRKLYQAILKKHARKDKILDFILKNFDYIPSSELSNKLGNVDKLVEIIMNVYSKYQLDKILKYANDNPTKIKITPDKIKYLKKIRFNQIYSVKLISIFDFDDNELTSM
ncbi:uncharacterized protein LOC105188815 [Harpegnathos saltator]|uniref:uncharacterized protein LOC105188815 n=1 Tax=Harpegnathos saltator TaxID=610380 RepID=UPI000DBEEE4A|nr:uncharacterized protein LOC105188815 [Harpegnathos saltator]